MGGDLRRAHPGRHPGRGEERDLERGRPTIRSRPTTSCARITARSGRSRRPPGAAPAGTTPPRRSGRRRWRSPNRRVRVRPGRPAAGDSTADRALAASTIRTGSRVRWTPRIQPLPARTSSTPGSPAARCGTRTRPRAGSWPTPASRRSADRRTPRPRHDEPDAGAPARTPARPRRPRHRRARPRTSAPPATWCRTRRTCRRWSATPSAPRRHRARPSGLEPRCPTTAVSTSRYSGSAARTTNADAASASSRERVAGAVTARRALRSGRPPSGPSTRWDRATW